MNVERMIDEGRAVERLRTAREDFKNALNEIERLRLTAELTFERIEITAIGREGYPEYIWDIPMKVRRVEEPR